MNRVRIGTRGSALALAQSTWVKQQIEAHYPELQVELSIIKTSGDRFIDRPIQRRWAARACSLKKSRMRC